jgi:hypothetical protein
MQYAAFEKRYHVDLDDRIGFFYLFTLPIIIYFAIRATVSLVRACSSAPQSARWGRVALVLAIAALCWSPAAIMGYSLVRGAAEGLAQDSNPATWQVKPAKQ